jgi:hypothetical protein
MSTDTQHTYGDCLSASWLSERLGVDPSRVDAMRRAGEIIGVRPPGSTTWVYPSWQWHNGKQRPEVPRIVRAAHDAGLSETELYDRMTMRTGLAGGSESSLVSLLVGGGGDQVVDAIRGSGT